MFLPWRGLNLRFGDVGRDWVLSCGSAEGSWLGLFWSSMEASDTDDEEGTVVILTLYRRGGESSNEPTSSE